MGSALVLALLIYGASKSGMFSSAASAATSKPGGTFLVGFTTAPVNATLDPSHAGNLAHALGISGTRALKLDHAGPGKFVLWAQFTGKANLPKVGKATVFEGTPIKVTFIKNAPSAIVQAS